VVGDIEFLLSVLIGGNGEEKADLTALTLAFDILNVYVRCGRLGCASDIDAAFNTELLHW
jgi:hypothetical protein